MLRGLRQLWNKGGLISGIFYPATPALDSSWHSEHFLDMQFLQWRSLYFCSYFKQCQKQQSQKNRATSTSILYHRAWKCIWMVPLGGALTAYLYRKWPGALLSGTVAHLSPAGRAPTTPGLRTDTRRCRPPSWCADGLRFGVPVSNQKLVFPSCGKVPKTHKREQLGEPEFRFSASELW